MKTKQLRALIFDLDGTLVDSEPNYYKGDKEFIEHHGGQYSWEQFQSFIGMGSLNLINWLKKTYNVKNSTEELLIEKDKLYRKYARKNTPVFPEMEKFLSIGESLNLPMAVASGSSKAVIQEILEISGLRKYFHIMVSAEEVENGKPEPDIFIETARRMNIQAKNCLVFEDSHYGLLSALSAKMKLVFIPSVPNPDNQDYQKAHCLYPRGMEEFTAKHCWEWIQEKFSLEY